MQETGIYTAFANFITATTANGDAALYVPAQDARPLFRLPSLTSAAGNVDFAPAEQSQALARWGAPKDYLLAMQPWGVAATVKILQILLQSLITISRRGSGRQAISQGHRTKLHGGVLTHW